MNATIDRQDVSEAGQPAIAIAEARPVAIPPRPAAAFTTRNLPFKPEMINKVTEALSDDERVAIRWLFNHGKERGDDMKSLAARIGKDGNTLYRVFRGEYGAKLTNIVDAINAYRRLDHERSMVGRPVFVATSVSQAIWERCNEALAYQRIAPIVGDWQIGKTCSLEHYTSEHNHGQTKYFRLQTGCSYRGFLEAFAESLGAPMTGNASTIARSIIKSIDWRHLVIFDEVDEPLLNPRTEASAVQIYMFMRELFDRSKCGMVMCGNREFLDLMVKKGATAQWMRKLQQRCIPPLLLPAAPPDEDLWALADHYHLPPAPQDSEEWKMARLIGSQNGLGQYVICLQAGAQAAKTLGANYAWTHFLMALQRFAGKGGK